MTAQFVKIADITNLIKVANIKKSAERKLRLKLDLKLNKFDVKVGFPRNG